MLGKYFGVWKVCSGSLIFMAFVMLLSQFCDMMSLQYLLNVKGDVQWITFFDCTKSYPRPGSSQWNVVNCNYTYCDWVVVHLIPAGRSH